jgi:hypothetical protein
MALAPGAPDPLEGEEVGRVPRFDDRALGQHVGPSRMASRPARVVIGVYSRFPVLAIEYRVSRWSTR